MTSILSLFIFYGNWFKDIKRDHNYKMKEIKLLMFPVQFFLSDTR